MLYDFHIHTTCSDGTFTPEEVVCMAKERQLSAIAITDHDTVSGLEAGAEKAKEVGIDFINGIEFSTEYYGKEVHIVGLFLNIKDEKFLSKIEQLRKDRVIRAEETIRKLEQYKIFITMEDILKEAKGDVIGRMHIANVLYKKGYVRDRKEAFAMYLGDHCSAYVPKKNLTPKEAVKIIKDNGGLSFIAHPKLITLGQEKVIALIDELCGEGLDGLEAFYPSFSDIDTGYYKRIAETRGILTGGGSDFHGKNRDDVGIGSIKLPEDILEKMISRKQKK